MPLKSKNMISITLTFDFNCLAFFNLGNLRDWLIWRLVFKSYSKIHISLPVMTMKKVWFSLKMLNDVLSHLHFWSSFSCLRINFTQVFHIPKFSVIIFETLSLFMSNGLVIIWTVNWWLPHLTRLTVTSVLFKSSFISLHLSLKYADGTWCYLNTLAETFQVLVMEFSPTRLKISGLLISLVHRSLLSDLKKRC